jgi:vacuolar protein sorting-associated protein 13A/C
MFEAIVASILDKYLGVYVSNFDSKNLKIGLLSGEVRLQNLDVIGSAFDQFDLPISVLRGKLC